MVRDGETNLPLSQEATVRISVYDTATHFETSARLTSDSVATLSIPLNVQGVHLQLVGLDVIPVHRFVELHSNPCDLICTLYTHKWPDEMSMQRLKTDIEGAGADPESILRNSPTHKTLEDFKAFVTTSSKYVSSFDSHVPNYSIYIKSLNKKVRVQDLVEFQPATSVLALFPSGPLRTLSAGETENGPFSIVINARDGFQVADLATTSGVEGTDMDLPLCPDPANPKEGTKTEHVIIPAFDIVDARGCGESNPFEKFPRKSAWSVQGNTATGIKRALEVHFCENVTGTEVTTQSFTLPSCSPSQVVKIRPFTVHCCQIVNPHDESNPKPVRVVNRTDVLTMIPMTTGENNRNPCTRPGKDEKGNPVAVPCERTPKCFTKVIRNGKKVSVEVPCEPVCPNYYNYRDLLRLGYTVWHPMPDPMTLPCP